MLYLIITILADVVGILLLGKAQGFERPWYLVGGIAMMLLGFMAFSFATKTIPTSIANALWSSLSMVLVVAVGHVFFKEHVTVAQLACVAMIMAGTVALSILSRNAV